MLQSIFQNNFQIAELNWIFIILALHVLQTFTCEHPRSPSPLTIYHTKVQVQTKFMDVPIEIRVVYG